MIRLLIVDDSETEIQILKQIFAHDPDIQIVGYARNGKQALTVVEQLKPDLITMDLQMPVMDGLEAIRLIMAKYPVPIVVISSKLSNAVIDMTFKAFEAGALSVLEKPTDISAPNFEKIRERIIETVKVMSEIKVIKRRFNIKKEPKKTILLPNKTIHPKAWEVIAIGTSVGGPQALKRIFSKLPKTFSVPIVVVQHMTPGFINGFTKWLDNYIPLTVKEALHQESLQKGVIYFAPDGHHLEIERIKGNLFTKLIKAPPVSGFCPSATVLLQSVAKHSGKNAIGILLTGMGNDGAEGLLKLRQAEGHTFIQDQESAVVFGMAGVAQSMDAVDAVVEIDKIADYLVHITSK